MCNGTHATGTLAQIYWVVPKLDEEVHAGALGFTRTLHFFAWASDPEQAKDLVKAHLAGDGLHVECFVQQPSPAQNQVLRTYCFPEHIIGLPEDVITQHLEPGPIREIALKAHGIRSRQLRKGIAALASATA